jgi:hypothetical protein
MLPVSPDNNWKTESGAEQQQANGIAGPTSYQHPGGKYQHEECEAQW